jgi:hypothetical protein
MYIMPYYKNIKDIRDKNERLRIVDKLLTLRKQLDREIPQKTATDTLLLATWNISEFGDNRRRKSRDAMHCVSTCNIASLHVTLRLYM